jgi:hypothetical protein
MTRLSEIQGESRCVVLHSHVVGSDLVRTRAGATFTPPSIASLRYVRTNGPLAPHVDSRINTAYLEN